MTNILVELFSVKGLFVYSLLNTDPTTSTLCHSLKQHEGKCCQHFSCDLCMSTPIQIAAHSLFPALQDCCGNCTAIEMAPSHTASVSSCLVSNTMPFGCYFSVKNPCGSPLLLKYLKSTQELKAVLIRWSWIQPTGLLVSDWQRGSRKSTLPPYNSERKDPQLLIYILLLVWH